MVTAFRQVFRLLVLAFVVASGALVAGLPAAEIVIESAAFNDPKIEPTPENKLFHPRLKLLWLEALARPETDYQREAADAIARAHAMGMQGLDETIKPLTEAVSAPQQSALVKLAAARALIALDARASANVLHQQLATSDSDFAQLVEPALSNWKFEPIRQTWLDRLNSPNAPRGMLVLAIRGLGEWKEAKAAPRLLELAQGFGNSASVRLAAAQSLSQIQTEGLLDVARKLAAEKSPKKIADRLVAATLLAGHSGKESESLLSELAVDEEPAVAAVALARLYELDPELVLAQFDTLSKSPDAKVRGFAARALIAKPNVQRLEQLAAFLNDDDTNVRVEARNALFNFASDAQYKDTVINKATEVLAGNDWHGLEQASILLAGIDHKPAAERIAQLLEFEQPHVFVAAAWSLRKLQVASTLPAMFKRAKSTTELLMNSQKLTATNARTDMLNLQLRELLEAFGQMKYLPAVELLVPFVPKGGPWELNTRCSAIYAGGLILAGLPSTGDVKKAESALIARLSDVNGPNPEDDRVRRVSAIALGRMKSKPALGPLRTYYGQGQTSRVVGYACAWAIRQITDEELADPPAPDVQVRGWFLEPLD